MKYYIKNYVTGGKLIYCEGIDKFEFDSKEEACEALRKIESTFIEDNKNNNKPLFLPTFMIETMKQINLDFGDAIRALKQGKKVARNGWNGKGMYLWLLPATEVKKEWVKDPMLLSVFGDREVLNCLGAIRMLTATGEVLTGWLASQSDMLAEDWIIVEQI